MPCYWTATHFCQNCQKRYHCSDDLVPGFWHTHKYGDDNEYTELAERNYTVPTCPTCLVPLIHLELED